VRDRRAAGIDALRKENEELLATLRQLIRETTRVR
jgi:hypothetical protein